MGTGCAERKLSINWCGVLPRAGCSAIAGEACPNSAQITHSGAHFPPT